MVVEKRGWFDAGCGEGRVFGLRKNQGGEVNVVVVVSWWILAGSRPRMTARL